MIQFLPRRFRPRRHSEPTIDVDSDYFLYDYVTEGGFLWRAIFPRLILEDAF